MTLRRRDRAAPRPRGASRAGPRAAACSLRVGLPGPSSSRSMYSGFASSFACSMRCCERVARALEIVERHEQVAPRASGTRGARRRRPRRCSTSVGGRLAGCPATSSRDGRGARRRRRRLDHDEHACRRRLTRASSLRRSRTAGDVLRQQVREVGAQRQVVRDQVDRARRAAAGAPRRSRARVARNHAT